MGAQLGRLVRPQVDWMATGDARCPSSPLTRSVGARIRSVPQPVAQEARTTQITGITGRTSRHDMGVRPLMQHRGQPQGDLGEEQHDGEAVRLEGNEGQQGCEDRVQAYVLPIPDGCAARERLQRSNICRLVRGRGDRQALPQGLSELRSEEGRLDS
jgi:hypothetical protein